MIKYNKFFVSVLITIWALYLRWDRLLKRELWTDENYQLKHIIGPFKNFLIHQNYGDHTSFPGEYLLTYFFAQMFELNKWGLAIPHIIVTVVGFYFLYKLCQVYFKTAVGYGVTFLMMALNKNLVFHAFEYRPYSVLPTLMLGCLYFSHVIIYKFDQLSQWQKIGIALFYFGAMNYHAYGITIVFLPIVFTLLCSKKKIWNEIWKLSYIKYIGSVLVVSSSVWVWYAFGHKLFESTYMVSQSTTDPFQFIPSPTQNLFGFCKGIIGNLLGFKKFYFLFLGTISIFWMSKIQCKFFLVFIIILIVIPLSLILSMDVYYRYWFIQRQFVWVMPMLALCIGGFWDFITCKLFFSRSIRE